jgi:hypothetical protein
METRVARLNRITIWILFSNACFTIMASEMANLNPLSQVQKMYYLANNITSVHHFPNTHHSLMYAKFLILKDRADSRMLSPVQDLGWNSSLLCCVCRIVWGFGLQMARRHSGALLRKELDSLSFLQTHP